MLGIDPIKSDQQVRGTVVLPAGTGRKITIAIFTSEENRKFAEAANADMIVDLNYISEITAENLAFDTLIATKEVIQKLKPLGRTIGPLGIMPNLKSGTLVTPEELELTVKTLKAGKIEFRNDTLGMVRACIGKRRFGHEDLLSNLKEIKTRLDDLRPDIIKPKSYYKW